MMMSASHNLTLFVSRLYKEFNDSNLAWTASRRGLHAKTKSLLDQSDKQEEVKEWIRAHMAGGKKQKDKAKEPPMTVSSFRKWMNDEFLPKLKKDSAKLNKESAAAAGPSELLQQPKSAKKGGRTLGRYRTPLLSGI